MKLKCPILQSIESYSIELFIDFWSTQYYYPKNEHFYKDNICKEIFTKKDVVDLYTWKNGMNLSANKQESLENKILSKLDIINDFKNHGLPTLDFFLDEFKEVSFVWKIFLLHIIKPKTYPIYDQHIHRAFKYLMSENDIIQQARELEFYFKFYLPFIENEQIKEIKKMDEAFFAFGQFLNTKNYQSLL
jgi:hypothetical protein